MRSLLSFLAALSIISCVGPPGPAGPPGPSVGEGEDEATGTERGPCYGNGTCDEGLTCASDVCVQLGGGEGEPCVTIEGSITLENSLDVAAMANTCVVTGNMVIGDGLTSLTLARLEAVGGDILVSGRSLTDVSLPLLATVGARFFLQDLPALATLSLPALRTVGTLLVHGTPLLDAISVPSLVSAEGFNITSVGPTLISAPLLETLGDFSLFETGVTSLSLPELVTSSIVILRNPSLRSLAMPKLVAGKTMIVGENPALVVCEGPAIEAIGDCVQ